MLNTRYSVRSYSNIMGSGHRKEISGNVRSALMKNRIETDVRSKFTADVTKKYVTMIMMD